jgi:hypothetical protein
MYYKLLLNDGRTLHRYPGWVFPTDGPGPWVEAHDPGPLKAKVNGVHVLSVDQLRWWARIETVLVEVEVDGELVAEMNKTVVRRARPVRVVSGWTDDALSRWAYECADRAVRIHATAALRAAGLTAQAERLASLAPVVDVANAFYAYLLLIDAIDGTANADCQTAYHVVSNAEAAVAHAIYSNSNVDKHIAAAAHHASNAACHVTGHYDIYSDVNIYCDVVDHVAERAWQSRRLAELVGLAPD